jgi:hypothetical protein
VVEWANPSEPQDTPDRCFDPALAEYPTRTVPLTAIVDPLAVTHAPERIAAYRDAMRAGDRFPPIAVLALGGRYVVVDGHKRFQAYRALPAADMLVEIWTVRRWLRDQWSQLRRKTRQQASVLARSVRDPNARREAARLAGDTLRHWRRVARSLRALRLRSSSREAR